MLLHIESKLCIQYVLSTLPTSPNGPASSPEPVFALVITLQPKIPTIAKYDTPYQIAK